MSERSRRLQIEGMWWCIFRTQLTVVLEQSHKASFRVVQIRMVNNNLRCHLSPHQSTRMVLRQVFNVSQVWPLTRTLHQFNLTWSVSQLVVFFAASKSKIENTTVSKRLCGIASPSSPFCQSNSSSSSVRISACLFLDPMP